MEIKNKSITIYFNSVDIERLDFVLIEAQKSQNLSDYDKEFILKLKCFIDYDPQAKRIT